MIWQGDTYRKLRSVCFRFQGTGYREDRMQFPVTGYLLPGNTKAVADQQ